MDDTIWKFIHARTEEYMNRRSELQDNLILEFLLGNPDLSINDIELVETHMGDDIIWYCRAKAGVPVPLKSGMGWAIRNE